ncbi:MAG: hypothetical protein IJN03_01470 [Bacilli bacterium]|nr:hypothetical protein [Bacilli bacterium]
MDLDKLINNAINDNSLVKINSNIYLTKYQIAILDRFHIEYNNCSDIKEILFLIDEYLESEYEEELDELAKNLQEFSYYNFTHK